MNTHSTEVFSWTRATILSVGIGVLVAGLAIFIEMHSLSAQMLLGGDLLPTTAPPAAVGVGSSYDMPGKPARLLIPAIGVDANIQSTGLSWRGTGDMGVPTNFTDVAWYNGGPLPGMPGSAVIDGHLDGKDVPQAVFYRLGDLKPGDLVEVEDQQGKIMQFKVTATKLYPYNATTTDIFESGDSAAHLNLITCAGDWISSQDIYNQRVVVFTQLVPGT